MTPALAGDALTSSPTKQPRNHGLDALRGVVALLVVLHHAAITYGASGDWFYKERPLPGSQIETDLLTLFCATNQAWFMGLFFLLAGYYTPPSRDRKGSVAFWRDRLLRLGVPLLAFGVLLGPMTNALARTAHGHAFWPALERIYANWRFEPGPLWFAEALLLFTAGYALWRGLRPPGDEPRRPFPSNATLLAAALATGAAAFLLRLVWPVGTTVSALQLGYFASYVVLFAAGCAAARGAWLARVPAPQRRLWLALSACTFPILPTALLLLSGAPHASEGGWTWHAVVYAWWEPFVAWGIILGLLGLFSHARWASSRAWRALGRRAYAIYVVHPPILVAVALVWRSVAVAPLLKFSVTGFSACALCLLAADLLLRVPGIRQVL